jgi:hypothetical protein
MTKSLFDGGYVKVKDYPKEKPKIRRYSVLPARAVQDASIHPTSFKVLAALCIHTNGHGICWPSQITIALHLGVSKVTVLRHIKRLIKLGYIRKLEPKKYPWGIIQKGRRPTNRYQVMFGADDPLPTKEQFLAPRASIMDIDYGIKDGKVSTVDDADNKKGGLGDGNKDFQILAHTFRTAVERTSGAVRLADSSFQTAARLHQLGVTAEQVRESTTAMVKDGLRTGRAPPMTLEQVARWAGLYKKGG